MSPTRRVIVLAGGAPVDPDAIGPLPDHDLVIAADSGLDQAPLLRLRVDRLVGDLDSASPVAVTAAEAAGVTIERHPADKDATDLALALAAAVRAGADEVLVIGGGAGRLDHLLGNALLLTSPALGGVAVEWRTGAGRAYVVRDTLTIDGSQGDVVSLLALGGPVTGIGTQGLRWALDGDDLSPGSPRGISNEMTQPQATVSVGTGVLLAVHGRSA